jgi:hypothetical protein
MSVADDIRRQAYAIEHEAERLRPSPEPVYRNIGWTIGDMTRELLRLADRVADIERERR